jgi:vancomycin resistance protein YoaR
VRDLPFPLLAVALVIAMVVAAFAVDGATSAGRVRRGITVGGFDLSGLTAAAAAARLRTAAGVIQARQLEVRAASASTSLTRAQAGLGLDVDASVADAMAVGRHGLLDRDRLRSWTGGVALPWRTQVDEGRVSRLLNDLDQRIAGNGREPALRVHAGASPTVELVAGRAGSGVDTAAARSTLVKAVAAPAGALVNLPTTERAPSVSPEAANQALITARGLLSAPVTVGAGNQQAQLAPVELAPLVRSKAEGGKLVVGVDQKKLDELLRAKAAFAYTTPRDATFKASGSSVSVIASVAGKGVDPDKAAAAMLAVAGRTGVDRQVALPVVSVQPELTTAKAKALRVTERVSSFTTTFSAADAPRVHNIGLIAAAMNHKLVMPGDVFSMNEATGQRTAAKGYRTAHVIVNGELVDGLGGGVCQAGTTMFNSVLMAGLPVLQRRNHSLHISHYPLGRDATLNWPGTDLKWRNDSPYGIWITSSWSDSSLTFTLWSTSRHYRVSLSTSAMTNFRDPPTKYEDDPTLPKGTETVKEPGSRGFDVTLSRTVTQGGNVVRRDQFVSNYVPWTRIVLRGTGKAGPAN